MVGVRVVAAAVLEGPTGATDGDDVRQLGAFGDRQRGPAVEEQDASVRRRREGEQPRYEYGDE